MRRIIEIGVAIILLCGGVALFYYYSSYEGLALSGLAVFARRAALRMALKFLGILALPFIPVLWMNKGGEMKERFNGALKHIGAYAVDLWKESPWPVRVVLGVLYMFGSGVLAFLLLVVFPVRVQNVPFVGHWLKQVAIPYLMRAAAARGVELNMPKLWGKVPAFLREPAERVFWWVWTRTAGYAIKTSQISAYRVKRILAERRIKQRRARGMTPRERHGSHHYA